MWAALWLLPVLIWFRCLEIFLVPRYTIEIPLDRELPMLPIFVVPYVLFFFYVAAALIYIGIHSKENYYKAIIFLCSGMSLAYFFYMIFPNAQALRPIITQTDFLSQAVKFIYEYDTPTNVCPSIHVFNTMAVNAVLFNTAPFKNSIIAKSLSTVLAILICLSTIFLKQHSILDGIFAGLLCILFYIPLFKIKFPTAECNYNSIHLP
jgi:membrane-associated phospholipid phosphatase